MLTQTFGHSFANYCTPAPTHIRERKSLNTPVTSHQCNPHTCTMLRSLQWPLCINSRESRSIVGGDLPPHCSSYSPKVRTLANWEQRRQWTYPCGHAAILYHTRSVLLSTGHLRYDWKLGNQCDARWKNNKFQWGADTHWIAVKLVYSINRANIPNTGTATVDSV